ncbi:hypothetical protein R1T40_18400 [Tritonibacter scottomollicae]|uniref:Uncharacterized protein n=1 Tax=Tritonibacter scottomollicae TaxID=483013 RepID=A0ABZ0HFJ1_TRISK|nr:hypothetical protein [Tritonibacter scottomollicae]WOI32884.1 hypothetical protein R1T40_18400 [Tritonibacter scottomollicae]
MSGTDFERLNIVLAARDREFARAMDRNIRRVERFAARSQRDLSKISKRFDALGFAAKRMGPLIAALGAGAVIGKLQRTVSTLDDIGKTADKIGLTTDALQEWRTIAESAGVAQGALDSSLERFNKRLGEAQQGGGAASKMLKQLGLDAGELATAGLDEAMKQVADQIAGLADPTERAAAAAALFGREGVAMVNLLREGSAGMDRMRQEARDLGIIIDESLIRGAEDAQTKLDLMSRVIDAQLNSALVELAPLLVGGATALADFARFINSSIDAVQDFLEPQTQLQQATDNLVMAMGDEIRQSQLLDQALGRGVTMSQAVAKAKLEEARTRHANAKAAISEHKAMVLGSESWASLTSQINDAQSTLMASGFHGDIATSRRADAYEQEQQRLAALIVQRQELIKVDGELQAHLDRTASNMTALEGAIGQSGGGLVSVEGTAINPIEPSLRGPVEASGRAASAAVPELTDYAAVVERIRGVFGDAAVAGSGYRDQLTQLDVLYRAGKLSAAEYEEAVGAVESKFEGAKSAAESLRSSATRALADIVTGSQSASDAVSGLLQNLAGMFANAAFGGLFKDTGIFASVGELLSFDGGGYTGSAPRSGGLDGKGGMLAMIHPQESVIDHTKGQRAPISSASNGTPQLNVNVYGANTDAQIRDMARQGAHEAIQQYDRQVLPRSVAAINNDPRRIG